MPVPGANVVVDVSHHNSISSWSKVKASGVVAVIHKATEGNSYQDKTYPDRKKKALEAGLLWGSYHFSSGGNSITQVENYLTFAAPQDSELICLDFEPSFDGHNMTYDGMIAFVKAIKDALGRYPLVYGGSLLREATAGKQDDPVLKNCPLWYARYSNSPIGLPDPWKDWTLWQYTDGNFGQDPHMVTGIGNCDRDTYNGSLASLNKSWPLTKK
jgi:lysozyme